MLVLLLATIVSYTVPMWEATGCDSLVTVCDSFGENCQEFHYPERMGSVEIWWGPRYSTFRLLRVKNVDDREGERDTLEIPSDTLASLYLVAVDAAGNRSCPGNAITVNGRVGVDPVTSLEAVRWFDVMGHRVAPNPKTPGIYFRRTYHWGQPFRTEKVIVL